jgi:hypothetical protein
MSEQSALSVPDQEEDSSLPEEGGGQEKSMVPALAEEGQSQETSTAPVPTETQQDEGASTAREDPDAKQREGTLTAEEERSTPLPLDAQQEEGTLMPEAEGSDAVERPAALEGEVLGPLTPVSPEFVAEPTEEQLLKDLNEAFYGTFGGSWLPERFASCCFWGFHPVLRSPEADEVSLEETEVQVLKSPRPLLSPERLALLLFWHGTQAPLEAPLPPPTLKPVAKQPRVVPPRSEPPGMPPATKAFLFVLETA